MDSIIFDQFESKNLGSMKNRSVMSPMTRGFADKNHCATNQMSDYYERRAKNGIALIITEGIIIHPSADGYNNVPHLYNDIQVQSWKNITEKIHKHNSKVYAQLWHCGRISHSDFTGGAAPVSSTNNPASGMNRQNNKPYGIPRALLKEELSEITDMFVNSSLKAIDAGFDGVQLHFGHGYLIDQFFDAKVNDRTDEYGGTVENRCRFALDIVKKTIETIGSDKLMIRISPSRFMGKIYNWDNLDEMLKYLIPELDQLGLRQLDVSCANANYFETSGLVIHKIRKMWPHLLIGGASLTKENATKEIENGNLDMVTWGRHILANIDFMSKLKKGDAILEMTNDMRNKLF